jgi:hypothetical protein
MLAQARAEKDKPEQPVQAADAQSLFQGALNRVCDFLCLGLIL